MAKPPAAPAAPPQAAHDLPWLKADAPSDDEYIASIKQWFGCHKPLHMVFVRLSGPEVSSIAAFWKNEVLVKAQAADKVQFSQLEWPRSNGNPLPVDEKCWTELCEGRLSSAQGLVTNWSAAAAANSGTIARPDAVLLCCNARVEKMAETGFVRSVGAKLKELYPAVCVRLLLSTTAERFRGDFTHSLKHWSTTLLVDGVLLHADAGRTALSNVRELQRACRVSLALPDAQLTQLCTALQASYAQAPDAFWPLRLESIPDDRLRQLVAAAVQRCDAADWGNEALRTELMDRLHQHAATAADASASASSSSSSSASASSSSSSSASASASASASTKAATSHGTG